MSTKSHRTATRPTHPAKGKARTALKARATTKAASRKSTRITAEPTGSKQSQLIAMLRSPAGGTIEQLTELTGWLPHTVRGTISGGLRKRLKLNVTCVNHVYRIAEGQA